MGLKGHIHRIIPTDEFLALINANNPSASNVFVTFNDLLTNVTLVIVTNYAALPAANTVTGAFYWCEQSQGTSWLPGPLGGTYYPAGLYYSDGVTWTTAPIPYQATQVEVDAGIVTDKFVTPATLSSSSQWSTVKIDLSTNSVLNGNQNILNIIEGTNMNITDDGLGNITFDSTGGGGGGISAALPFTTDHINATGNPYLIGDVVWYLGNIYTCIAGNDSIIPTNTSYWINLGAGNPLIQQPADWTSTSGNNQILNKPTIPATIVEDVTATAPITSSGGAIPDISTSMNTNKLIGRSTAGVGVMEEITLGTGLTLTAGTLDATGGGGGGIPHGIAVGTDTYTTTIAGVTAYAEGDAYIIRFTNGNTTSCTLNINGVGAATLYRNNNGVLIGGDIIDNGDMLCIYDTSISGFRVIGTAPNTLLGYITNADAVSITRGQVVYAFGGTGDRMTVKLANNVGDATSAQTVGLVLSTSIAPNQKGLIIIQGLLDGLSILPTATWSDGDPIYLGATPGSITKIKPYAPNHLVYLGVVTTASSGSAGRMYVKVQNGYELDELHNVQAQSPALKDTLWYDNSVSPGQWKTASIPTILGYTPLDELQTALLAQSFS